jgi:hypothetical protein
MTGFGVQRLRLLPGDPATEPGVFHWSPIAGAEYVSCALFACLPEVGKDGRDARSRSILNFDKCALARETTPIDPVVPFVVGGDSDTTYRAPKSAPAQCRTKPIEAPRRITRLNVGCMAYDATRIVAASPLLFVTPAYTGTFGGAIPSTDSCTEDQVDCYFEQTETFGTCLDGACQPRCATALDCCEAFERVAEVPDAGLALAATDPGSRMHCAGGTVVECVLQEPPVIGACRRVSEEGGNL